MVHDSRAVETTVGTLWSKNLMICKEKRCSGEEITRVRKLL